MCSRLEELFIITRNNNDAVICKFATLQRVVHRFANQPAQVNHGFVRRVIREGDDDDNSETRNRQQQQIAYESTLCKRPRDL